MRHPQNQNQKQGQRQRAGVPAPHLQRHSQKRFFGTAEAVPRYESSSGYRSIPDIAALKHCATHRLLAIVFATLSLTHEERFFRKRFRI